MGDSNTTFLRLNDDEEQSTSHRALCSAQQIDRKSTERRWRRVIYAGHEEHEAYLKQSPKNNHLERRREAVRQWEVTFREADENGGSDLECPNCGAVEPKSFGRG